MGGNVITTLHDKDETQTVAQKIPLKEIKRDNFIRTINDFLNTLNQKFFEKFNHFLFNVEHLKKCIIFNGSTSYVMNTNFSNSEVEKVKEYVGDIDIIINKIYKKELYDFLLEDENKNFGSNVIYKGCNKPFFKKTMNQINCIFEITFENIKVNVQIDFEFLDFFENEPIEFSRFGHSSNFKDAKENIKAVHHKYLLRSLIGNKFIDKNALICTDNSNESSFEIIDKPARIKIFDVDLGVCDKLVKQDFKIDGKDVYKELPRYKYKTEKNLERIFEITFGVKPSNDELKMFWSFVGLCELLKKYCSKEEIDLIHKRYIDLLWATVPERAQEIERNNKDLDNEVKFNGYKYFVDLFKLENKYESYANKYYSIYGTLGRSYLSESFKDFVIQKNYVQEFY